MPNETPADPMLVKFAAYMRTARLSPATIGKRVEILTRLLTFLGHPLLEATLDELAQFQASFDNLARASIDIYTRHVHAFYKWAVEFEHLATDPSRRMVKVKLSAAVPHPTRQDDLRVILACAMGRIRTAYILAAFAGLRCGEICQLRWEDLTIDVATPTMLVHGKGSKDRIVPLLPPVIAELLTLPTPRRGRIITRDDGRPAEPLWLSGESTRFLKSLGMPTTLHSMRAAFATQAAKMTHDPLFVRDLLGHASVKTTEIYMRADVEPRPFTSD
jgi:integrase